MRGSAPKVLVRSRTRVAAGGTLEALGAPLVLTDEPGAEPATAALPCPAPPVKYYFMSAEISSQVTFLQFAS